MTPYYLLLRAIGWKVVGEFPDVPKSILTMAPHTSYWDCIVGKLVLLSLGKKASLLTASEYFFFPLTIGLKILGAYPVGAVKGRNAIMDAIDIIKTHEKIHVVICPEGQLKETDYWNPGFYYMAARAEVPIIVTYLDYKKKEAGIKTMITDLSDKDEVMRTLAECYKGCTGRHPEKFLLPKINPKKD